ncbi:MAG: hypothetical protein IT429_21635 [Gemmataceae bacterium]|nr:hypothetical protein [Gemmataceae bacterium]
MVIPDVGIHRTVGGVPFDELSPGYTFGYTQRNNESRETRVRKIAAALLPQFLRDMLGNCESVGRHGTLRRQAPDTIGWQMFCTDVEFVQGLMPGTTGALNVGAAGGRSIPVNGPRYNELILACHYQAVPYDVTLDQPVGRYRVPELLRFVTREIDYAAESLPMPGGAYRWQTVTDPPGVAEDLFEPPPKIFNTGTLTYTWHFLDRPPATAIRELRGTVNQNAFDDEAAYYPRYLRNHAPETLLFTGAKLEPVKDLLGNWRFNVIYQFAQRDNGILDDGVTRAGWNHLYRARTQKFERVVDKATATKGIYLKKNFDRLFDPEPV